MEGSSPYKFLFMIHDLISTSFDVI